MGCRSPPKASSPFGSTSARPAGGNGAPGSGPRRGIGSRLTEWRMVEHAVTIAQRRRAFLSAPRRQRVGDVGIGKPMPAAGELGQEAARHLVLALRARLEAREAFAQAVLDALVVAGLEMQAGQV